MPGAVADVVAADVAATTAWVNREKADDAAATAATKASDQAAVDADRAELNAWSAAMNAAQASENGASQEAAAAYAANVASATAANTAWVNNATAAAEAADKGQADENRTAVLTASNALKAKDDATDAANRDASQSAIDAGKDAIDKEARDYDAAGKAKSADESKSRKDKVDALKTHTETVVNAALAALEAEAVAAKAGADKVAVAAVKDVIDKAQTAFTAAAAFGAKAVDKAVADATAKANEAIGATQKNLEARVDAARREVTRIEGLTLAQLNPQDASTVSSGTTWLQSAWSWIGRQWEGFSNSIVGQILIVAALAAVTALAIAFASPFIAAALLIGFAALTLGNIAIATYENYAVKGQSFGQALWSGIVEGSVVGTMFEAITNYDLATLTYQGNTWQERLGSSGMALAQLAAARYGVKFGKSMTGRIQKTCFAAGTPIRLETGFKPIESIRAGDRVLCRDEHDPEGAAVVREVEDAFERVSPILRLTIAGQEIRTTGEHPFYVPGRGWIMAGRLRAGDAVASLSGEPLIVDGVVDDGEVVTVYNFRVKEYHTYFVGRDDWGFAVWVHNTNGVETELNQIEATLKSGKKTLKADEKANLRARRDELRQQLESVEGTAALDVSTTPLKRIPASESQALDIAKQIERDFDKKARRAFHDVKEKGMGDRTIGELKADAQKFYTDAGREIPNWLK